MLLPGPGHPPPPPGTLLCCSGGWGHPPGGLPAPPPPLWCQAPSCATVRDRATPPGHPPTLHPGKGTPLGVSPPPAPRDGDTLAPCSFSAAPRLRAGGVGAGPDPPPPLSPHMPRVGQCSAPQPGLRQGGGGQSRARGHVPPSLQATEALLDATSSGGGGTHTHSEAGPPTPSSVAPWEAVTVWVSPPMLA